MNYFNPEFHATTGGLDRSIRTDASSGDPQRPADTSKKAFARSLGHEMGAPARNVAAEWYSRISARLQARFARPEIA